MNKMGEADASSGGLERIVKYLVIILLTILLVFSIKTLISKIT